MADRPEFLEFPVDGATLGALAWPGIVGAPTVLALHDIAGDAWTFDPLAHHLGGAAQLIALDLRGRGRSEHCPGPFGLRRHADDVAAVVDAIGGPLVLVGHSMGAAVALLTAERHPGTVRDLLLVDGGPPLDESLTGADDATVRAALAALFGPAVERVGTVWPDRVSYHSMWSSHPAFTHGIGPDLERNLLAGLVPVPGGFRVSVDVDAVGADGHDLLTDPDIATLLDRRVEPTTIVRAELGATGRPPALIPAATRDRYPAHRWVEATGLNHYTVLVSADGASLVADVLRDRLTSVPTTVPRV